MEEYFSIKYIVFFAVALFLSYLINSILLKFVKTLGIRNSKETLIRWSTNVKPSLGGITFFIIFLLSFTLHPYVFSYKAEQINYVFTGIIAATTLGFTMGLADDAYNTKPLLKLFVQILCGLILIYTDTCIHLFDNPLLNYLFTILWVVGLMNSINMLDNMDGITTIVSLFISLTFLFIMIINRDVSSIGTTLVLGLIASLLAFLYFNWSPAKMYMGDTGSQFLGVLLAALSVHYLWNPFSSDNPIAISRQFLLPLIVFIVPISDTLTVTINRISKGKSPFIGGKDHTTHHLSYLGLSEKQVALTIMFISIVSSVIAISFIYVIEKWNHFYTVVFSLYFLLIFLGLFFTTKQKLHHKKELQ